MDKMFQDENSSLSGYLKYTLINDKHVDLYLHFIGKHLKDETYEDGDPITVVDFGTCDGLNIIPFFKMISDYVGSRGNQRKIRFIFNDNDTTCVPHLEKMIKAYLMKLNAETCVVCSKIGIEFYWTFLGKKRIGIDLTIPPSISNGLFWFEADDQELDQIKKQSEEDWERFLRHREHELKSGGFVITHIPVCSQQLINSLQILSKIFRDMLTENIITMAEFQRTIIPISVLRTTSDLKRPFENGSLKKLRLANITKYTLYLRDLGVTADTISESYKSWMYNSILHGLSQKRSENEKKEICDILFARLKNYYQENENDTFKTGFEVCICIIQKI